MSPEITFLIPCYRQSERLVRLAIDSLFAQRVPEWTALVVDDSPSGEAYRDLVSSYADERLAYVRTGAGGGIGAAWNFGLGQVKTPLFAFLHADDELESDYLGTMLGLACAYPVASLLACWATVVDAHGAPVWSFPDEVKRLIAPAGNVSAMQGEGALARLLVGNFLFCPTIVYRTGAVLGRRFSTTYRFVLDLDFTANLLLDGGCIVLTKRRCYRYRRVPEGETQILTATGARFDEELQIHYSIGAEAARRGYHAAALAGRLAPTVRLHVIFRAIAAMLGGEPKLALTYCAKLFACP